MLRRIAATDTTSRCDSILAGWHTSSLAPEFGPCRSERFSPSPGLNLVVTRYAPSCDLVEESDFAARGRTLTITVSIGGESGFRCRDGQTLDFRRGHTTVSASCATRGERHFLQGKPVDQLRVSIDGNALTAYVGTARAERMLGRGRLQQMAFHATSAVSMAHAQALMRHVGAPERNALAIHLHMLGLLNDETWRLSPPAPIHGKARALQADLPMVERAYALMQTTLSEPMSLSGIAALVGLSPARLRQGFYQRYDCSPQQAALELRMQHAMDLLEQGVHVATAAYRVGYNHPANFSAAFTRHFGRTPKSVAKSR